LYYTNIDCCIITESWLTPDFTDGLLDPQHKFSIYRCDRIASRGGGVCVLVTRQLKSHNICHDTEIGERSFEIVGVDIINQTRKIRMISVYRTPRIDTTSLQDIATLTTFLEKLINNRGPTFIVGDLNCPSVNWSSIQDYDANHHPSLQKIADFAIKNGFIQCVNEATRNRNILDVVLINEPLSLCQLSVDDPFGNSDHCSINFSCSFICDTPSNCTTNDVTTTCAGVRKFLWKEGDYASLNEYLHGVDWNEIVMYNFEPNSIWAAFKKILDEAIDLFVPSITIKETENITKRNVQHYPKKIKVLLNRKRCLWRRYKSNGDTQSKDKYDKAALECKEAIRDFEKSKETKLIESGNNGDFFKFVNNKLSYTSGVGALQDGDDYTTDNARKAEILNATFCGSQQSDNGVLPSFDRRKNASKNLETIDFEQSVIYRTGRRIKPKMSTDPDGYCPFFLTKVLPSISGPLSIIYQSFMSTGNIPDSWKTSIITPLFKKGTASDPNNYRPVAITSIFSKLMERVIVSQTSNHLKELGLISKEQHGFLKSRSTSTNLMESISDWTVNFSSHSATDVAYIDFARAFDKVCHSKLVHKLKSYGIDGDLLRFVENFLSNRKQCTKVGNNLSTLLDVKSGVIQGSCIGPLLFIIFINDITDHMNSDSTAKLYADDIKLYTRIETSVDIDSMQENLNQICNWSSEWQMEISVAKCFILPIGGKHLCLFNRHYSLHNFVLPTVLNIRDLGIIVDSNLSFSNHVDSIVSRANIKANLIIRCFISGDRDLLVKAFTVYVRPVLEFDSPVWSPRLKRDIEKVESVQRHFSKRLKGLDNLDYKSRLELLNLESLELRRLKADLIFTYKLVFGIIDMECTKFFKTINDRNTRGHAFRLDTTDTPSSDVQRHFFNNRIINVWNNLPADVDFNTLSKFKNSLSKRYLSKYCILDC